MAPEHLVTDLAPRRSEGAEPDVKDAASLEDGNAPTEIRYRILSYVADYPVDGLRWSRLFGQPANSPW